MIINWARRVPPQTMIGNRRKRAPARAPVQHRFETARPSLRDRPAEPVSDPSSYDNTVLFPPLIDDKGRYAFPDAVTTRGAKHLRELAAAVANGDRALMLYLIQRSDGSSFTTADDIDSAYDEELRRAVDAGVEILAYRAEVSPEEIRVIKPVEVEM